MLFKYRYTQIYKNNVNNLFSETRTKSITSIAANDVVSRVATGGGGGVKASEVSLDEGNVTVKGGTGKKASASSGWC